MKHDHITPSANVGLSLSSCGGADHPICTPRLSPDTHPTNMGGSVEIACEPSMASQYMQPRNGAPRGKPCKFDREAGSCVASNDAAVLRTIWKPA